MIPTFTKLPQEHLSAGAEAAGLRWLREASSSVVQVVSVDEDSLTTKRINQVAPSAAAARRAGQELARIHLAGAPAFGSPPAGWEGPNYIGTQRQECTPVEAWGNFYSQQRVLPFAESAYAVGHLSSGGLDLVRQACAAIESAPWAVQPARIHGDLWAGNLLFGEDGPVFIDVAAHGGHPETDLGMLSLFGAPFLDDIYAGYHQISPLSRDVREWTPLHQLHPLAVHAYTHGAGYSRPLTDAALATLERLSPVGI